MNKSILVILLAAVMSGCNDYGVTPPIIDPPLVFRDYEITIGVIPGIHTSLQCTDSLGTAKTFFSPAEPIFLRYTVINGTGKDRMWGTSMSNPFAEFFVIQGSDTLADSFAAMAFLAVPSNGTLKNGDSLTAGWRVDPSRIPLPPGAYLATASPRFVLVDLGVPGGSWKVFDITP